jgi:hypothetical protein
MQKDSSQDYGRDVGQGCNLGTGQPTVRAACVAPHCPGDLLRRSMVDGATAYGFLAFSGVPSLKLGLDGKSIPILAVGLSCFGLDLSLQSVLPGKLLYSS